MATPPFHRRIIPIIFILIFLVIAPLVVFYTAGYRWNAHKGKIERNGTVIIDSLPKEASVDIDNRQTNHKTPVTIQNMPPGLHNFRIYKSGYHEWSKNLDVKSEFVTFINNVWLWKSSVPVFINSGDFRSLSVSPDNRYLLKIEKATTSIAYITDLINEKTEKLEIEKTTETDFSVIWSGDSKYLLLIQKNNARDVNLLVDVKNARNLGRLPASGYRFTDNALVGTTENSILSIRLRDAAVSRTTLARGIVDDSDTALLQSVTGTEDLVFITKAKPEQGFILPSGDWRFWEFEKKYLLLNDGRHWLSLIGRTKPDDYYLFQADFLLPSIQDANKKYLAVNYSEIWTWQPDQKPDLIYRQTEKIKGAVWHAAGHDIFFATENKIFAINLDQRDGYQITELAEFDEVYSLVYLKGVLQIAGNKDKKNGLWSLSIE